MNFYEMTQQVAQSNTNTNQFDVNKNDEILMVSKLARKFGEKSSKYTPLVKFIARNKDMLKLFSELIEEASLAQQGITKTVFK